MRDSFIRLFAPAKINLSLELSGKRADGYHEVKTLMAPLTLADEVSISIVQGDSSGTLIFSCDDPTLPKDAGNICVQAFHAFQRATGITTPVAIHLQKNIPHGAGLGGGSSDAAAVLSGLNTLFKNPLTRPQLEELAALLGSDVSFFLQKAPAWCGGRGEKILEVMPLPSLKTLLIKPPFSVETAWAYRQWDAKQWLQPRRFDLEKITIFNDLEGPVFDKYLILPVLKEWLAQRPEIITAWMSGSGSTMVALLHQELTSDQNRELETALMRNFGESLWIVRAKVHGKME
jgi:4-diphosphocytidyl-2-C-methyl-D-erythritol kinase